MKRTRKSDTIDFLILWGTFGDKPSNNIFLVDDLIECTKFEAHIKVTNPLDKVKDLLHPRHNCSVKKNVWELCFDYVELFFAGKINLCIVSIEWGIFVHLQTTSRVTYQIGNTDKNNGLLSLNSGRAGLSHITYYRVWHVYPPLLSIRINIIYVETVMPHHLEISFLRFVS